MKCNIVIYFYQCLIGEKDVVMAVNVKVEKMVPKILTLKHQLGHIKLIISNFQKTDLGLITSECSMIEIDNEV